jgi:hypothetical protein
LRSEAEHKDLVGQIGQLNLYRESNAMLRSEVEKLQAELREWKIKFDNLQKQVAPLMAGKRYTSSARSPERQDSVCLFLIRLATNRELVATIDGMKLEIKSIVDERDRWKKRMEDYQANIKRIDPEEHRKVGRSSACHLRASATHAVWPPRCTDHGEGTAARGRAHPH